MRNNYLWAILFLLLGVGSFTLLDFSQLERSPASGEERAIGTTGDPRVNQLIENQKAFQARHDVWNNPNADFFYLSTYEFEEDAVGLSQVKWAVERAREGKTVHIVLDESGHGLSQETMHYMLKNGVNLHSWSPKLNLTGIRHRYRRNRQTSNPISAGLKSVFRQVTYRTHDKILFNNATSSEAKELLEAEEHVGQVIVGGRNSKDSHFGLDMERAEHTRVEDGVKKIVSNPKHEYEHEVMVHSEKFHRKVKAYITDLLTSTFTVRIRPTDLDSAYKRAVKQRDRFGKKWRRKVLQENIESNGLYEKFSKSFSGWLKTYEKRMDPSSNLSVNDKMADDFFAILEDHDDSLRKLMEEKKINPHFFTEILSTVLEKDYLGDMKVAARRLEKGEISVDEFFEFKNSFVKSYRKKMTLNLLSGKLKIGPFKRLIHPGKNVNSLPKRTFNKIVGVFGVDFNLEKYENLERKLKENEQWLERQYVSSKPKNWIREAVAVDDVDFAHDTVDDKVFKKKVMERVWETIGSADGDIYYNSQYGIPTENAFNAIDNFLRFNSAAVRLADQRLNQAGVGVGQQQTNEFVEVFLELFRQNEETAIQTLKGNTIFSQSASTAVRKKMNKASRERFVKSIKSIAGGSEDISRSSRMFLNGNLSAEKYYEEIVAALENNRENIVSNIMEDKDQFEKGLIKLRGFIDDDPDELLGKYEQRNFYFLSNSTDSWMLSFDEWVHRSFHLDMEEKWIQLGKGLHVAGLEGGGRVHSKVSTTKNTAFVGSGNFDPRSGKKNTEVFAVINAKTKGNELVQQFSHHLQSYMNPAKWYIRDGRFVRESNCPNAMRRFILKSFLRSQL